MVASVRPPATTLRAAPGRGDLRRRGDAAERVLEWVGPRRGGGSAALVLRLLLLLLDLLALLASLVELALERLALRLGRLGDRLLARGSAAREITGQVLEERELPVGLGARLGRRDDSLRLDQPVDVPEELVDVDHVEGRGHVRLSLVDLQVLVPCVG